MPWVGQGSVIEEQVLPDHTHLFVEYLMIFSPNISAMRRWNTPLERNCMTALNCDFPLLPMNKGYQAKSDSK